LPAAPVRSTCGIMRSALAPTRLTAEINVMSERVPGRGSVVRVLVAEDMRILRETRVALLSP